MSNERYAMITVVSTHRMRYAVPIGELQKLNPNTKLEGNDKEALTWAEELVMEERVKEFSQKWLGEQTVDRNVLTQEEAIKLFDSDNEYLADWTEEQKIKTLRRWEDESVM
jgi:hypothetical protein